jgi:gliding motility-associated-like protein
MKPKAGSLLRQGLRAKFTLLFVVLSSLMVAQDVPPGVPNIVTFGAGSYIIPMDNDKQALNGEPFNLSAYGLIYYLLDNGIELDWVITSGKSKDAIDFSCNASRVFPTTLGAANLDFRASAFIIDVSQVVIEGDCTGNSDVSQVNQLIEDFGSDVAVYTNTQAMNLDVRYHLTNAPVIGFLDDGGFTSTGTAVLDYAEVPYSTLTYSQFQSNNGCYTTIIQPHLSASNSDVTYTNIISNFVNNGGNFFAQCSAIEAYEETALFLTTQGATYYSQNILNGPLTYINNDMPIMQFHGETQGFGVGSNSHFALVDAFQSFAYGGVYGTNEDNTTSYLVAAGDLNGAAIGGNIFYLAGHNYTPQTQIQSGGGGGGGNTYFSDVIESYNMNRVMLNAMFVPATWATICTSPDQCICPGESANIGCDFDLNIGYTWSPAADLTCADCPNPIASPTTTTVYTATSDNGCSSVQVTVFVDCPFSNTITATSSPVCEGNCSYIYLTADAPGTMTFVTINNLQYAWADSILLCAPQSTVFDVVAVNDLGTTFTTTNNFVVLDAPDLTSNDLTLCFGEAGVFTASGADSYAWTELGVNTANANIVADSSYTYEVIGTNANGCADTTYSDLVVIPIESIIETSQIDLCVYDVCTILEASGIQQLNWYDSYGSYLSSAFTLEVCPQQSTFYVATTTDIGCYLPDTVFVNVVPIPDVDAGDDIEICPGIDVTLTATGAFSYVWTTENGTVLEGNSPTTSFLSSQTLFIEGFTAEGCSWNDTIQVTVFPEPVAYFTASADTSISIGTNVDFTDMSTGATCWSWDFGLYSIPSVETQNASVSYPEAGTFEVELTVCNEYGCYDTYALYVDVDHEFAYYVPNTFSPNGDGTNDVFFVDGIGIDTARFDLKIFDRWGEMIYEMTSPDEVWMGNHLKGGEYYVQDGVYNWILLLRDEATMVEYEAFGHVLIMR